MATGDKAYLLNIASTNITDNNAFENTPARLRTTLSSNITYNLNLAEETEQIVSGAIKHNSQQSFATTMTVPIHQEGAYFYNNVKKTLSYYNENQDVTVDIGRELLVRVYNDSGATIPNGAAVRPTGALGGLPTMALSKADVFATASVTGIATADILNGQTGYVTYVGEVSTVDTSAWAVGDFLYLSDTVEGGLTTSEPAISSFVGVVLSSDVDGSIIVGEQKIKDPNAIGQVISTVSKTQALTTTPAGLSAIDLTSVIQSNVVVTSTVSGTGFRIAMKPSETVFSGRYKATFHIALTSSANKKITAEIYRSGIATGIKAAVDLTNNNTDEATIVMPSVIIPTALTTTDTLEIHVSVNTGTSTITVSNMMFNIEKAGVA